MFESIKNFFKELFTIQKDEVIQEPCREIFNNPPKSYTGQATVVTSDTIPSAGTGQTGKPVTPSGLSIGDTPITLKEEKRKPRAPRTPKVVPTVEGEAPVKKKRRYYAPKK